MTATTIGAPAVPGRITLDNALCFHLYAASHAMTRFYRPFLDKLGLSYPQLLVLMALWQRDGRSVRDIGETLLLDSGTLSPVIKRLQASGFVTKARRSDDERQVVISLTEAGRAIEPQVQRIGAAALARSDFSEAQCGALVEDLDRLIERLGG